jgi:hypothetical protein
VLSGVTSRSTWEKEAASSVKKVHKGALPCRYYYYSSQQHHSSTTRKRCKPQKKSSAFVKQTLGFPNNNIKHMHMHLFPGIGMVKHDCHAGPFRCRSRIICRSIGDTLLTTMPCICMITGFILENKKEFVTSVRHGGVLVRNGGGFPVVADEMRLKKGISGVDTAA